MAREDHEAVSERGGEPPPLRATIGARSFAELFTGSELAYYLSGAAVYIVLGLVLLDVVLNWIVGPLFIVLWIWWVPPLVERYRAKRQGERS